MSLGQLSDAELLAWLAWGEAEGEGPVGQLAVMHTVLNRVAKARWWGQDVRSVILTPHQYDGLKRIPPDVVLNYLDCFTLVIAQLALASLTVDPTFGATHFHTVDMADPWGLPETVTIGNHIFRVEA